MNDDENFDDVMCRLNYFRRQTYYLDQMLDNIFWETKQQISKQDIAEIRIMFAHNIRHHQQTGELL